MRQVHRKQCWLFMLVIVTSAAVQAESIIRSIRTEPVLLRQQGKEVQPITLDLDGAPIDRPGKAVVRIGEQETEIDLKSGIQTIQAYVSPVQEVRIAKVQIVQGNRVMATGAVTLNPVRRWEIHLIHQTHLDIGFTHKQTEVLQRQVRYLHQALDFIQQTQDYPEDAKFKWHPEGMWAIDEFLRTADEPKRKEFLDAVRNGYIHLDGFYVHMLTGLGTEEELLRLLEPAKRFERKYGVEVLSAIGSDVPGYTWGLVSAMGQMGLKYLNMAPNNNHRLGYIYRLANQPFYWVDPSGAYRILCWINTHSYIYFWSGGRSKRIGPAVVDYIHHTLEKKGFPYDIAQLRYEIGGDNGYPDVNLAKQVKEWNENYANPKIILSTNTRFFKAFEARYGTSLPSYGGDFTPYWEDGAASTSADLAVNRAAKEKLIQAERLWSLVLPSARLHSEFDKAWYNAVMYDEHTWGAHCSISKPFSEFTVFQEKYKQQFALNARDLAERIITEAIEPEGVYFSFPLNVPGGEVRIDVPFGVVRPGKDQLDGANLNYYSVQRWVDVSNEDYGVTWVTLDAPMLKFHPFRIIGRGRGCLPAASFMYDKTPDGVPDFWLDEIKPTPFFYSWVMTNHWECNYKAYQEGMIQFRYVLRPHTGPYDAEREQQFGRGICQPLLAVHADAGKEVTQSLLEVTGDGVIVNSLRPSRDGRAYMIRLLCVSDQAERFALKWNEPKTVYLSDPQETRGRQIRGSMSLPAYGVLTLRAE